MISGKFHVIYLGSGHEVVLAAADVYFDEIKNYSSRKITVSGESLPERLAACLDQVTAAADFTKKTRCIVILENGYMIHTVPVPFSTPGKLQKILPALVEDSMPYGGGELLYRAIPVFPGETGLSTVIYSLPKSTADSIMQVFVEHDVRLEKLAVLNNELVNIVNDNNELKAICLQTADAIQYRAAVDNKNRVFTRKIPCSDESDHELPAHYQVKALQLDPGPPSEETLPVADIITAAIKSAIVPKKMFAVNFVTDEYREKTQVVFFPRHIRRSLSFMAGLLMIAVLIYGGVYQYYQNREYKIIKQQVHAYYRKYFSPSGPIVKPLSQARNAVAARRREIEKYYRFSLYGGSFLSRLEKVSGVLVKNGVELFEFTYSDKTFQIVGMAESFNVIEVSKQQLLDMEDIESFSLVTSKILNVLEGNNIRFTAEITWRKK